MGLLFKSVYDYKDDAEPIEVLWQILAQRTPEQSISHTTMPTREDHARFVRSMPYAHWWIIYCGHPAVGAVYLTKYREIGVFVLNAYQGRGIGTKAIEHALKVCQSEGTRALANINPNNRRSRRLFERMGARLIQVTYELPGGNHGSGTQEKAVTET